MIHPCDTVEAFQHLLDASKQAPVVLFKHSTRCPFSARAHEEFTRFAEEIGDQADCWQVLVIEQRPVSLEIAAVTGVLHQSPQALLIMDGVVRWHTSHSTITCEALHNALTAARPGEPA